MFSSVLQLIKKLLLLIFFNHTEWYSEIHLKNTMISKTIKIHEKIGNENAV